MNSLCWPLRLLLHSAFFAFAWRRLLLLGLCPLSSLVVARLRSECVARAIFKAGNGVKYTHPAFGSPSSNPTTDKVAVERHSWLASSAMRSEGMPVILHLFIHPVIRRRRLRPAVASSATKEYYFWIVALVAVVRWTAFRGWTLKKWINIVTRNGIRQKWFAGRHTQYLIYSS